MTAPDPEHGGAAASRWRLTRPAIAVPAIFLLLLVVALLTPEEKGARDGSSELTTYSAAPLGAKALYELAGALGWRVSRWTGGARIPLDTASIAAVLAPPDEVSAIESHRLLERVRAGGALLYVLGRDAPLADSLGVKLPLISGGTYVRTAAGSAERPGVAGGQAIGPDSAEDSAADEQDEGDPPADPTCAGRSRTGGAMPLWGGDEMFLANLEWRRHAPADTVVFARMSRSVSGKERLLPVAVGFPMGRGRVVVIADPDLLRNDVLRVCHWGADVVAVRMLEYLRDGGSVPRRTLWFDEYRQGYGAHPGTADAVFSYLVRVPSGRLLLQAFAAGVLLLLAMGPRLVAPRDPVRAERRSPFEHIAALATAYSGVGASRTAMARLVRGVRRRVEPHAAAGAETDDRGFLARIAAAHPALAGDVATVQQALDSALGRTQLVAAGDALARIERSLLSLRGAS